MEYGFVTFFDFERSRPSNTLSSNNVPKSKSAATATPLTTLPRASVGTHVRFAVRLATACLLAYWLGIFLLTHLPSSAIPRLLWSDKVYHAGAFAGLSFLLCWALPTRLGSNARLRQMLLAALIAIAYGSIDEFTQKFIPGRSCDIWDLAADAVGALIGVTCYLAMRTLMVQFSLGRNVINKFAR